MKHIEAGIIGGGLGGLSLAILLARQGKEVTLWEKSSYPFHRVCGEYISRESYPFLQELLPEFPWQEVAQIDQLVLSSPTGKILRQKLGLGGIGISRFRLDEALAKKAREEGIQLLEGCRILDWTENENGFEVKSSEETWACNTLFLSYGKGKGPGENPRNTNAARNFVGIKYHIRFDHPANEIQLHNFRNGYAGMSRVEDGISCLCYLVDSRELQSCGNDIQRMETEVLSRNPQLKRIFSEAEFLWPSPKVISGVRFGFQPGNRGNALVLGDAAGSIAPLSGNGMSMALRSSYGLANILRQHQKPEQIQQAYQQFRNRHFSARIRAGSLIQDFFGKELLGEAALNILRLAPDFLRNKIIESTHGIPF